MLVAFATGDGTFVDQHFGWCRRFDVYELSPDGFDLVSSRCPEPAKPDEEHKIDSRLNAVRDCAIVYVASIGATAAARVVNARIHPVKVKETERVADLLARLREVLAGTPPPWLRKLLVAEKAGDGGCRGSCREPGADREKQRPICHPEVPE